MCQSIVRPLKNNLKSYLNSILTKLIIWKSFERVEKYNKEKGDVSLLYVAYTVLLCTAFAISLAVGLSPLYPSFLDHTVHIQETHNAEMMSAVPKAKTATFYLCC